ncbi:uncharacterized protein LOC126266305 [Aethina tumida]|uniref:uncharacterized protein LOC126266305 n=1 Tax=Aethina tumida TaxID=116153 RepID=UPI002147313A|nr:uncharacterized protein LOC126266305 [Aethina tumida]
MARSPILFLLLLFIGMVLALSREIVLDDEGPNVKLNKLQDIESEENDQESPPCYIEYQVVKRLKGSCIKIHDRMRACVAENYLEVSHPQCIYK